MTRRVLASDLLGISETRAAQTPDPLSWAEQYRVFNGVPMAVPGPLREIYRSTAPRLVVMKGAQLGVSEWAINFLLHTADTKRAGRGNGLYIMPTADEVARFQQARVQPAIQASSYLRKKVGHNRAQKGAENMELLRLADAHIYWRGANSTTALRAMDCDSVVIDEADGVSLEALALAEHRLDSSEAPLLRILGTPTFAGVGIEAMYLAGDQRQYVLACPSCGFEQSLQWETNVIVDGDLRTATCTAVRVCGQCRDSMEAVIAGAWRSGECAHWVAQQPGRYFPSYQFSQLYRPGADLVTIARKLAGSAADQQQAWNQHLGLPHSPEGDQLSLTELVRLCSSPFKLADLAGRGPGCMGVDVRAARLHCWVLAEVDDAPTLVFAGEIRSFEEADALITRFDVHYCVVDAHPEQRAATAFRDRHRGVVYLADYVQNRWPAEWTDSMRSDGRTVGDPRQAFRVVVDRTAVMDEFVRWLREQEVAFPSDAQSIPGFFAHLQAPVRSVVTGANGRSRAVYDEGSRPDDYFHAGVYAYLAWQQGASSSGSSWPEGDHDDDLAGPIFKGLWTKEF